MCDNTVSVCVFVIKPEPKTKKIKAQLLKTGYFVFHQSKLIFFTLRDSFLPSLVYVFDIKCTSACDKWNKIEVKIYTSTKAVNV